jgi:hypothetical protein
MRTRKGEEDYGYDENSEKGSEQAGTTAGPRRNICRCSMLDAVHVEEQMKGIRDDEYLLSVYN